MLEMLQQRLEVPQEPSAPREPLVVESVSETLETLEPAGGESHERFHERYMSKEPGDRSYDELKTRKQRLVLSRKKLQQAFIMKEIIGPPKGID